MYSTLVSRSSTLPVPLASFKANLAIDTYDDDSRISDLAWSVIEHLAQGYGVATVTEQWTQHERGIQSNWYNPIGYNLYAWYGQYYPHYHSHRVRLAHYPVQTLDAVHYYDTTNTLQSLATSNFILLNDHACPAYVIPLSGVTLPSVFNRPDAWQFTYTAGYASVPQGLQHYLKMAVNTLNENREGEIVGSIVAKLNTLSLENLLAPYIAGKIQL